MTQNNAQDTAANVLILYYSQTGTTEKMAHIIARGVEKIDLVSAKIRTVPELSAITEKVQAPIPSTGALYATVDDLLACDALILGCPTYFGNMPAPMKAFIDSTSRLWLQGALVGKPAAVFSASTSLHGGQESTLLTMMLPLLHHGMLIHGIPYTETRLLETRTGGSPYGATRLTQNGNDLTEDEHQLCLALGSRIACTTKKLSHHG